MKERPILFSAPMVRAILDGSKTQTRRVMNPQPMVARDGLIGHRDVAGYFGAHVFGSCFPKCATRLPYGVGGDRLWVRETWGARSDRYLYRADYGDDAYPDFRWRPSIHMPRAASRITLELTEVRVRRLQDIDGYDAIAEGITIERCGCEVCRHSAQMCPADQSTAIMEYASLWEHINGKRPGCSWEANPWVWALTFKRAA